MTAPVLAVGDGALGFWGALGEVFPETAHQRCWVHKLKNILNALPKSAHPAARAALKEVRDLILTGSTQLRAVLGPLTSETRALACARLRPGDVTDPAEATKYALRSLARRHQSLTTEMADLAASLDELTALANPALRAAKGVGPDVAAILLVAAGDNPERLSTEAGFAALCGASPIEASSGKVNRHRLNRSGNRQANHALWRIAMTRLVTDPATKAYMVRRTAEGKTRREIVRCLKRYIAREMFQLLTNPNLVPVGMKLRVTRTDAKVTLATAATALGTTGVTISRLERGLQHNSELARRYEEWLETAS